MYYRDRNQRNNDHQKYNLSVTSVEYTKYIRHVYKTYMSYIYATIVKQTLR